MPLLTEGIKRKRKSKKLGGTASRAGGQGAVRSRGSSGYGKGPGDKPSLGRPTPGKPGSGKGPGGKVGKPKAKPGSGYGKGPGGTAKPGGLIGPISSCFVAGVQVELADGVEKNITEISVGDIVKTQDGNGSVVKVFHSKAGKQKLYGFNDKEPFVTEAHPFMTQDGWKKISELEVGDTLYRNGLGIDTVDSIESKEIAEDTPVYNFHVDNQENYYADGYLVHNKTYPKPPVKRPKERLKPKPKERLKPLPKERLKPKPRPKPKPKPKPRPKRPPARHVRPGTTLLKKKRPIRSPVKERPGRPEKPPVRYPPIRKPKPRPRPTPKPQPVGPKPKKGEVRGYGKGPGGVKRPITRPSTGRAGGDRGTPDRYFGGTRRGSGGRGNR